MLRVIVALLLLATGAAAQRPEPSVRDWLRQHRLLLTPDEEKVLGRVQPGDLEAFVRLFWARRDPDPATPDNPARTAAERARTDADARFSDAGVRGSETACGQVLALLGNPDEVTGRELRNTFDTRPTPSSRYRLPEQASRNATRDGARRPELWTYKSTPARTFRMPGGDLKLQFDDGCEFEESGRTLDELARVAAERVLHPEIAYAFGADGRLRPGAAATGEVSPARTPFDRPASDFALSFEPVIQVPAQNGAYTAGILRGGPGSLPPPAGGLLRLTAASRSTPGAGPAAVGDQRTVVAAVDPDGSFVTSYGFTLPAGRHEVEVALLDPATGRGAVAKVPVEAPDYAGKAMIVSPLAVLAGLEDAGTASAGLDPYEAFAIGSQRLRPRAGNGLLRTDSLRLLVLVHNAPLDAATGKAALKVSFSVLQGGQPIARGTDQRFDTAGAVPMVGPISLAPFVAGSYVARVEVADEVGKAVVVRETPFQVKVP